VSKSLQSGTVRFPISASYRRAANSSPWKRSWLPTEAQAMAISFCWYETFQALSRSASACSSAVKSAGAILGAASWALTWAIRAVELAMAVSTRLLKC
jgi:hypothetical protein